MLGKVVLITGASSGLGAGTAVHLASKGCLLALTGRSREGLADTLKACLKAGCKENQVLLIPADLQNVQSLPSIVDKTVEKFGRLDVLVNNAGNAPLGSLEASTAENFDMVMNINLRSVLLLTQRAMPHLAKTKGNVVNISSPMGQKPYKGFLIYGMSKAALDHFTRTVALEVADRGVRVNGVSPGMIKTPIYERNQFAGDFEKIAQTFHALGRAGSVDEVARAVEFLADSSQSSFTTGSVLQVDGGACLV